MELGGHDGRPRGRRRLADDSDEIGRRERVKVLCMDVAKLSVRAIERRWRGHGEFQTTREVAMAEQRKKKGEDNGRLCVSRSEEGHTNLTIDV